MPPGRSLAALILLRDSADLDHREARDRAESALRPALVPLSVVERRWRWYRQLDREPAG